MNKYDAFLIKYAEIGIKGKNRHIFEEALVRQIRIALRPCQGSFNVIRTYGRVFVEAKSDYDFEEVTEALSHVSVSGESARLPNMISCLWNSSVRLRRTSSSLNILTEVALPRRTPLKCAPGA